MHIDPALGSEGYLAYEKERLEPLDDMDLLNSKGVAGAKDRRTVVRVVGCVHRYSDIVRSSLDNLQNARAALFDYQRFQDGNQAFRAPTFCPGAVVPVGGRNIGDSFAFPAHSADVARRPVKWGVARLFSRVMLR